MPKPSQPRVKISRSYDKYLVGNSHSQLFFHIISQLFLHIIYYSKQKHTTKLENT